MRIEATKYALWIENSENVEEDDEQCRNGHNHFRADFMIESLVHP